ncbi:sugar ABC transporter, permease component [Renibacterium salmoninarum ATCC 33209]|uniref:Sugar ABC transporter, permease component n=1 Tax=Renibacterium salmoninarum (strain ATCC 33209 / DSM 20767 / JCM 11484 / NBRC 15589 / NCIMB 2235) TaxID=288705 RepID=A9WLZ7_RENSM|nr:carbohydrate ABC transporter permease [Renibacterium salmoninarum]ABY22178.1 sugar ABC transporter, permease component [Renibacterium salmoninarum ATCC 33209]
MSRIDAATPTGTDLLSKASRVRKPFSANKWLTSVVLLIIAGFFCVPLLWVIFASLNPSASLAVKWPKSPSLANFDAIMNSKKTFRLILNSLILCGGATILTVLFSALAAYPLSRYQSRARRPFLLVIIFATSLPITAIMVPVYALFVQVNLIDSMFGAIVFLAASSLPYGIFLMKNFMDGAPKDIEESAWTEGASTLQALRLIVMPLIRPGTAVVTIFTFVGMWGNFFVPFMLLLSPDNLPASVSFYTFSAQYGQVAYGQLAAFSLVYSLPVVILYLFMGRRLGTGFTAAGGIKG